MRILAINASLSGRKTGIALNHIYFDESVDYTVVNLKDLNMSFADGRDYRDYENDNRKLVQKMIDADALIIATPFFQASIPGVLKNLFDLLPINALQGKTVGIIVTAGSPRHYLVVQQQLIPILHYLKTDVISKYVFLEPSDFDDNIIKDDIVLRLESLSSTMLLNVKTQKKENEERYSFL